MGITSGPGESSNNLNEGKAFPTNSQRQGEVAKREATQHFHGQAKGVTKPTVSPGAKQALEKPERKDLLKDFELLQEETMALAVVHKVFGAPLTFHGQPISPKLQQEVQNQKLTMKDPNVKDREVRKLVTAEQVKGFFQKARKEEVHGVLKDLYDFLLGSNEEDRKKLLIPAFALVLHQIEENKKDPHWALPGNCGIVLDSFREEFGQDIVPQKTNMPLEEALVALIFTLIDRSPTAVSYDRIDATTGKVRPTKFPLRTDMVTPFLEGVTHGQVNPTSKKGIAAEVMDRTIQDVKGEVVGNPAKEIYRRIKAKAHKHIQDVLAAELAAKNAAVVPTPKAAPKEIESEVNKAMASIAAFDEMLLSLPEEEENVYLESTQVPELIKAAKKMTYDEFEEAFDSSTARRRKIIEKRRSCLEKLQKFMRLTGHWTKEHWDTFDRVSNNASERDANFRYWDNKRGIRGKQHLLKPGAELVKIDKPVTVEDMLRKQDYMKQRQGVGIVQEPTLGKRPERERVTAQEFAVLRALQQKENQDGVLQLALGEERIKRMNHELKTRIYELFQQANGKSIASIVVDFTKTAQALTDKHQNALIIATAKEDIRDIQSKLIELKNLLTNTEGMTFDKALSQLLNPKKAESSTEGVKVVIAPEEIALMKEMGHEKNQSAIVDFAVDPKEWATLDPRLQTKLYELFMSSENISRITSDFRKAAASIDASKAGLAEKIVKDVEKMLRSILFRMTTKRMKFETSLGIEKESLKRVSQDDPVKALINPVNNYAKYNR